MILQEPKAFQRLTVWQKAHALVVHIYQLTFLFPSQEQFGLVSQMRRAAVSISSNIAEGYERRSPKEKVYFFRIAKGSLMELLNQMLIARDVGFVQVDRFQSMEQDIDEIRRMLVSLIEKTPEKMG